MLKISDFPLSHSEPFFAGLSRSDTIMEQTTSTENSIPKQQTLAKLQAIEKVAQGENTQVFKWGNLQCLSCVNDSHMRTKYKFNIQIKFKV